VKILDRLSGQWVDKPPSDPLQLGRWRLDPEGERLFQNGSETACGDALVPNACGEWRLIRADAQTELRGAFAADALPAKEDIAAFKSLRDLLLGQAGETRAWLDWCDRSPLAPGLGETIREHPLEQAITAEFGHLALVCQRPQTHIRLEPQRLRVTRARRFDRKVYVRLAAHTEDWARRKISGVEPSHVLAQVREEQWDLYENRVAVRLVDGLARWLNGRLSEVRRIQEGVFEQLERQRIDAGANWRRGKRLYEIWGEATEATAQQALAERTRKRLEDLLHRVLGLMDSPLYRALPRRVEVASALRTTNLLANHDHYRGVARLWDAWSRLAAPRALSLHEVYRRNQDLIRGFDAWCMLLAVRALKQLGCEPESDEALELAVAPGREIPLARGYRLTWAEDGIRVLDGDRPRIRLVPLVHALEHTRPGDLDALRADLAAAVAEWEEWTVVLHPAMPESAIGDTLAGVLDPPFPWVRGAIDWLRVSPLALDSVERVARLLRWAMLAPRMLAYPPQLGEIPSGLAQRLPARIAKSSSGYILREPLADHEITALNLDVALERAIAECNHLKEERDEADRLARELKDKPRERADHNIRKRQLLEPISQAESTVKHMQCFKKDLNAGSESLADLAICPVCGATERPLKARGGDRFLATCIDCDTRWELLPAESGERIPVLAISVLQDNALPPDYRSLGVDGTLGCDVLAIPDLNVSAETNWRAPRDVCIATKSSDHYEQEQETQRKLA
jgi:hypothetical protein